MKKFIVSFIRAVFILYILNIITNDYFSYNFLNLFILTMLSYPGIILIYFLSII